MLAEDLNVAFPLTDWVREAFVPPIARREASFRDPGPDPIRVDATHLIVPRNTEYEIFTVGKAGAHPRRVLRAGPQDAARPGRAAGRPGRPTGPTRGGADRAGQAQLALVDGAGARSCRSTCTSCRTTTSGRPSSPSATSARPPAAYMNVERDAQGLHRAGLDRVRLPELLRPARLRLPPPADGRDGLGRPPGPARLRPGLRPSGRGPRRARLAQGPERGPELRDDRARCCS